ncbi:MAG: hypothetical protein R3F19_14355 [Verrucomicrobiales bacterium]
MQPAQEKTASSPLLEHCGKLRLANSNTAKRQVLYLGEINDSQKAAWCKSIAALEGRSQATQQIALFPNDRQPPEALSQDGSKVLPVQVDLPHAWNCVARGNGARLAGSSADLEPVRARHGHFVAGNCLWRRKGAARCGSCRRAIMRRTGPSIFKRCCTAMRYPARVPWATCSAWTPTSCQRTRPAQTGQRRHRRGRPSSAHLAPAAGSLRRRWGRCLPEPDQHSAGQSAEDPESSKKQCGGCGATSAPIILLTDGTGRGSASAIDEVVICRWCTPEGLPVT